MFVGGQSVVSGEVEVWKSESDCTPAECAMLIEEAHQISDELGIVLLEE